MLNLKALSEQELDQDREDNDSELDSDTSEAQTQQLLFNQDGVNFLKFRDLDVLS
jgi:hypothetical protein